MRTGVRTATGLGGGNERRKKRGEETGRVKRKRAGGEEGIFQVEEKEGRKEGRKGKGRANQKRRSKSQTAGMHEAMR